MPSNYASKDIDIYLSNLSQKILDGTLGQAEIDTLLVMHHFTKLMFARNSTVKLYSHLCDVMNIREIALNTRGDIEGGDIETRHHVLQAIAYLMLDLGPNLRKAIAAKSVRYNYLKKDFDDIPEWYAGIMRALRPKELLHT